MDKRKHVCYLYIDDERYPEKDITIFEHYMIARDYIHAIRYINWALDRGYELLIDLDHDLGEGKSGYDVCKYIIQNNIPCQYRIHSMNPVGRFNMNQLLQRYGYKMF